MILHYMDISVAFFHSLVDEWMGWFHLLAITNNVAMNVYVQVSVHTFFKLPFKDCVMDYTTKIVFLFDG